MLFFFQPQLNVVEATGVLTEKRVADGGGANATKPHDGHLSRISEDSTRHSCNPHPQVIIALFFFIYN